MNGNNQQMNIPQQPQGYNPQQGDYQQQPPQQQQGYNPHARFASDPQGAGLPQSSSNPWDGFGDVPGDDREPFFEEGNHLCQVVELVTFEAKDDPRIFFKAKFRVVESTTVAPNSFRATMSTIYGAKKMTVDIGRRTTKALVMALLNKKEATEIDGQTMQQLTSQYQPAKNLFVRNTAVERTKKDGSGTYVRDNWQPVSNDEQAALFAKYGPVA